MVRVCHRPWDRERWRAHVRGWMRAGRRVTHPYGTFAPPARPSTGVDQSQAAAAGRRAARKARSPRRCPPEGGESHAQPKRTVPRHGSFRTARPGPLRTEAPGPRRSRRHHRSARQHSAHHRLARRHGAHPRRTQRLHPRRRRHPHPHRLTDGGAHQRRAHPPGTHRFHGRAHHRPHRGLRAPADPAAAQRLRDRGPGGGVPRRARGLLHRGRFRRSRPRGIGGCAGRIGPVGHAPRQRLRPPPRAHR